MNEMQISVELLFVIVNHNLGSKVLKIAKQHGIAGGIIYLGQGTVKNKLLEFLDLNEVSKEIVMMISDKDTVSNAIKELNKVFHFEKQNHGIVFTTCISNILGVKQYCNVNLNREESEKMYNAIYAIVDKGKAMTVIDAAKKAGARGGTIINARGSGRHETEKIFSMDIEPEKELILILAENEISEKIAVSVKDELQMDQPGNGIIFIQNLSSVYGLY